MYENWLDERKADKANPNAGRLYLCHAVILLARARKDRRVDSAAILMYEGERPHPEVPDHALDMHPREGRRRRRDVDHFFTEGARIVNAIGEPDPYLERARAARVKRGHQLQLSAE